MKIVVVSDIHANLAAIKSLPEDDYDQLWCLGDIVGYGPRPHETIRWRRDRATAIVRGNHDHAVGFAVIPECSALRGNLAAVTREYTQEVCTKNDFAFLRELPLRKEMVIQGKSFHLVQASPTDPLSGKVPENSELWLDEVENINADFLLVGHTHTPFVRQIGSCTIVNPGSIGQPKPGRPLACYAVWEDGRSRLENYEYSLDEEIAAISQMPIPKRYQQALISILLNGQSPGPQSGAEVWLSHAS